MDQSPAEEPRPDPSDQFPKADVIHRFIAKFIDFLIIATLIQLLPRVGFLAGMTYLLIADGFFQGMSLGKRLIGLQTVLPEKGVAATFRESILRNIPLAAALFLLIMPYIGWLLSAAILVIEALLIIGNLHGHRLGDEVARTQVIDGKPIPQVMKPKESLGAS